MIFFKKKSNPLVEEIRQLRADVRHLTLDRADVAQVTGVSASGNPYQSYTGQVTELSRKFMGMADWGNQVAQNIINIRSAFTIGSGVKAVKAKPSADRELKFIQSFMDYNGLNAETAQDWVREVEIEGKFLCRLIPEPVAANRPDGKMSPDSPFRGAVLTRYLSWTTNSYKVSTEPEDYTKYTQVEYKVPVTSRSVILTPDQFIYRRFGGRSDSVNETPPRLGPVLRQLEDLDKALYDWRRINNLFAAPTPWIDAEDDDSASRIVKTLRSAQWKVGKLLVTSGAKFAMVEAASGRGIDSLEKEIISNAKFISGASGVPVHFLGLPDLLSNRATADNLLELVVASTSRERRIWVGVYTEMFREALRIANEVFQAGFDESAIVADVPFVSAEKMKQLVDVWLPLYAASTIDLSTFLSKVPEIDADKVKEQLEEEQDERDKKQAELLAISNVPNMGDPGPGRRTAPTNSGRGGNGNGN